MSKSLLELVSTVIVPATTKTFIAKEKFVRDTSTSAKVKISGLGGNFTTWFLEDEGRVEAPITKTSIHSHRLKRASVDTLIIEEIGGETKAETTLTAIYSMMKKQPRGKKGFLLTDGWANIFYVRDKNGVLRAVSVDWNGDGWHVFGCRTDYTVAWGGGSRTSPRNFVLTSTQAMPN